MRWGIVIAAQGVALSIGLYPLGWLAGTPFPLNFGPWMVIAMSDAGHLPNLEQPQWYNQAESEFLELNHSTFN